MKAEEILRELCVRYPALAPCKGDIERAYEALRDCFADGKRLYLCGNGGSAADCDHIAGELMKSFLAPRPLDEAYAEKLRTFGAEGEALARVLQGGFAAVSLCAHTAFSTAFANDAHPDFVFAQAVHAWGRCGDALLTLSTSGNSRNCLYAAVAARAAGMRVLFLGGGDGGKLASLADVSVLVPARETYRVQELHLPVYHCLCAMLEASVYPAA